LEESVHSLRRKQQASDDNRQLKLQKQAAKNLEITKNSSCCRRILPPTKQAQFSSFLPSFLPSFLSVSKIQPNTQADEDQKIQNTKLVRVAAQQQQQQAEACLADGYEEKLSVCVCVCAGGGECVLSLGTLQSRE